MPSYLYLVALLPPPPVRERVRELKEEMRHRFRAGHALKSPAHITLQMPFRLDSQDESHLISLLGRFASGQAPFPVDLDGFGCFPPRVLFLKIEDHKPLVALMEALQAVLAREPSLGIEGSGLPFHPHMTIATRDLKEEAFYQAWAEFKDRPFEAAFEVRSLFLLQHNGQFWEIYREFKFGEGT